MTDNIGVWGIRLDQPEPIGDPKSEKPDQPDEWMKVFHASTDLSRDLSHDRRSQRGMREIITVWLIALFFLVICLAFTAIFLDDDPGLLDKRFLHLKSLLDVIIGPVATLLSSAIGFYFGMQASHNKSSFENSGN